MTYAWRGAFDSAEVDALHAEAFGHALLGHDWHGQVERHSLGWVTAREDGELVGFVNVPWDGDTHAFVMDTLVRETHRRRGIGRAMVAMCVDESRARGCEWLHVDFEDELRAFYLDACGFQPTDAGTIALRATR